MTISPLGGSHVLCVLWWAVEVTMCVWSFVRDNWSFSTIVACDFQVNKLKASSKLHGHCGHWILCFTLFHVLGCSMSMLHQRFMQSHRSPCFLTWTSNCRVNATSGDVNSTSCNVDIESPAYRQATISVSMVFNEDRKFSHTLLLLQMQHTYGETDRTDEIQRENTTAVPIVVSFSFFLN